MAHEMMVLALQLGVIIIAAKFNGWFFSTKLKQPKVLGELIAGMIIGPFLLGSLPLGSFGPLFRSSLSACGGFNPSFSGIVWNCHHRINSASFLFRIGDGFAYVHPFLR